MALVINQTNPKKPKKMKKLFVMLCLLIATGLVGKAQLSIFTSYNSKSNTVSPCATIFGTKPISEKISFTYFALVNQNWAETYIGLNYHPVKWMSLGLSAGIEQNPALYRTGASLWLGHGKMSFLTLLEKGDGPNNYWYKSTLAYKASDKLSLGLRAWRYTGLGPVAEYSVKDLKFWVMPAYDLEVETSKLVVGIDIKI